MNKFFKFLKLRLKKKLIAIAMWLIILSIYILPVGLAIMADYDGELFSFSNPLDYCKLSKVEYSAIVHDDPEKGSYLQITEFLTYDMNSIFDDFREVWRELPEETTEGLKTTYKVHSVSQIDENGKEIPYLETSKMYWEDEDYTPYSTKRWHHSDSNGRYPDNDESLLIYIPWMKKGTITFKVVYDLYNAAYRYNDCSELYISMFSGNSTKKLDYFYGEVLVPNELMPKDYYLYTFGTRYSRFPYSHSTTAYPGYNQFKFELDKNDLKFDYTNQYLEFSLIAYNEDKHIFTKYAKRNYYYNDDALQECIDENEYYQTEYKRTKSAKTIILCASVIIIGYAINLAVNGSKRVKEKYNIPDPEIDYDYFRDIPSKLDPIFASELVTRKIAFEDMDENEEEFSAILLSLARKGYVQILKRDDQKDWATDNTYIRPINLYNPQSETSEEPESLQNSIPLYTSERLYLDLIQRHIRKDPYNDKILVSKLEEEMASDFLYTNSFIKDMTKKPPIEAGVMNGLLVDSNYKKPSDSFKNKAAMLYYFGWIVLILFNLISYFTSVGLCYGIYTVVGIILILSGIYCSEQSKNLIKLTQEGANEQAQWVGLYNFLKSDTLINERAVPDVALWEEYLIYATAFGISEKVIKALKVHAVEINTPSSSIIHRSSYIHSTSRKSISRSSSGGFHTSHSGFHGGHGYGGGGRGGGGGGGGH